MQENKAGITVSVCMIVRDESPVLARCLDGVSVFADEIVIVDTGSIDDTREIALRYTDRVYDFPWIDDFAAARNVSFSYASMDYVMWLDADDVISYADAMLIKELKHTLPGETDMVFFLYGGERDQENIYNNSFVFRDRWFRRSLNPVWHGRLHEYVTMSKEAVKYYDDRICIRHCKVRVNDPERNMRIHKLCMAEQTEPDARNMGFLCNEYFSKGELENAVSMFDELTGQEHFPAFDVKNALSSYIFSMKSLKRNDELICRLLSLQENGVVNEMLLTELGAAFLARKEYDEAEKYLKDALELPVDYRDMSVHFEAYHEFIPCQKLSKLYAVKGDMKTAYEYFKRAEKIYPENKTIKLNRAYFNREKVTWEG